MDPRLWMRRRQDSLTTLENHIDSGRVDPDIVSLLDAINSLNYAFTTSSCSGRIQVYAATEPGEKFTLRTLGKWHFPIREEDLVAVLEGGDESIWLAVLPPILHVVTCSTRAAFRMLDLMRSAGFKRAGIISASRDGITLEAMGTERMEAPLRLSGVDLLRDGAIPLIVARANSLLVRSKRRIARLEEELRDEASGGLDNLCGE